MINHLIAETIKSYFSNQDITIINVERANTTGYDWQSRIVLDGVGCRVAGIITGTFNDEILVTWWM